MLDSAAFPAASAYLASLPDGLDSFPDCTARPETYEGVHQSFPQDRIPPGLPESIQTFLRGEQKGWQPEVVPLVTYVMLSDVMGRDGFLQWTRDDASRLFQRGFIRHLMKLVSPTLVALGAASRWKTLRRGTAIVAEPVKTEADRHYTTSRVTSPHGLYPEIFAHGLTQALGAAVSGARGTDIRVELVAYRPDEIVHRASWNA